MHDLLAGRGRAANGEDDNPVLRPCDLCRLVDRRRMDVGLDLRALAAQEWHKVVDPRRKFVLAADLRQAGQRLAKRLGGVLRGQEQVARAPAGDGHGVVHRLERAGAGHSHRLDRKAHQANVDEPGKHAARAAQRPDNGQQAQRVLPVAAPTAFRGALPQAQHIDHAGADVHRRLHGRSDAYGPPLGILLDPLGQEVFADRFLLVPPVCVFRERHPTPTTSYPLSVEQRPNPGAVGKVTLNATLFGGRRLS